MRAISGVAIGLWLAVPAQGQGLLPWEDLGMVRLGAAVYGEHCAACHGADLEGQVPNWRSRDADGLLPAPPHDETGHTWHHADLLLFRIVKYGTEALIGGDYRSNMIGFEEVLSDAEILAVLAYIKSTWPPQVRAAHDRVNAAQ